MSEEPTKEQIRKFWEWYGFKWDGRRDAFCFTAPDGKTFSATELRNFGSLKVLGILFKYAVPKAKKVDRYDLLHGWVNDITLRSEDPALALYWALDQVRKEESNGI